MCSVAESYARWESLDAQVLGISVDSPYANAQFAEHCGASFPILSDFNRDVIRAYGVLNPDFHGLKDVAYRSAFVIDRQGKVSYTWASEDSGVMPPFLFSIALPSWESCSGRWIFTAKPLARPASPSASSPCWLRPAPSTACRKAISSAPPASTARPWPTSSPE